MNAIDFPRVSVSRLRELWELYGLEPGLGLDIDDTLAQTNNVWARTLCEQFGVPDGYRDADHIAKTVLYLEEVPAWSDHEGVQKCMDYFRHSDDFQETIPPFDGVVELVREITAHLPIAAYISARPDRVTRGTQRWLYAHGFPPAPLLLRKRKSYRKDWKSTLLAKLSPRVLTAYLDDNQDVAHYLPDGFEGTIFIHRNAHEVAPLSHTVACDGIVDAFRRIREQFPKAA